MRCAMQAKVDELEALMLAGFEALAEEINEFENPDMTEEKWAAAAKEHAARDATQRAGQQAGIEMMHIEDGELGLSTDNENETEEDP